MSRQLHRRARRRQLAGSPPSRLWHSPSRPARAAALSGGSRPRRRQGDHQRRLRAARQPRRCSTRSGTRTSRSSRSKPRHHDQQHLHQPVRGAGDVHRPAAGRHRAERLLHLLHRPQPGARRRPGRRHHAVRQHHDRARAATTSTRSAMAAVTAGKTSTACRPPTTPGPDHQPEAVHRRPGLDPDQPPTTWAEVAQGRQGDHRAGPRHLRLRRLQRGQQRRLALLLRDGRPGRPDGQRGRHRRPPSTAPQGTRDPAALHQMRFTDNSMSPTQQLAWGTLQKQMAAGKLGMYIARAGRHLQRDRPAGRRQHQRLRHGPAAQPGGTPAGSLSGGNDYMFNKQGHPGADQGRHQVAQLRGPDPGQGPVQLRAAEGRRVPGRLPGAAAVHRRAPHEEPAAAGRQRHDPTVLLLHVRRGRTRRAWASRPTPRRSTRRSTRSCSPC